MAAMSVTVQKNSRAEGPARVAKKVETTWRRETKLRRARSRAARRRGNRNSLDRLRNLRAGRRARHVLGLDDEALLERLVAALLARPRLFANALGNLGNDQRLGAIQHALLAEREALGLAQERQALQHVGHFVDRAGAHLVGVVLEAPFPVLMIVDLAVAQEREEVIYLFVREGLAQADAVNVGDGHQHRRV